MAIVINKAAVRRALEQWFIAARAGDTLSARETAEMSASEAAAAISDDFYDMLVSDEDTINGSINFMAGEDMAQGQILKVDFDTFVVSGVGEKTASDQPVDQTPTDEPQPEVVADQKPADLLPGFFG